MSFFDSDLFRILLTIIPAIIDNKNDGPSTSNFSKYIPIPSRVAKPNLNIGTERKPVIIAAIAPFSLKLFQNKDKIIVGQNVAAIPDQPKMTNQKMVLSGTATATNIAITKAKTANIKVMSLDVLANCFSVLLGLNICW